MCERERGREVTSHVLRMDPETPEPEESELAILKHAKLALVMASAPWRVVAAAYCQRTCQSILTASGQIASPLSSCCVCPSPWMWI